MITDKDMAARSRKLRGLLQQKLGVRGHDLRQSLRRAGRRLPRGVRKQGEALIRAEMLARNPKTARQVDAAAVDAAFGQVRAHLEALDATELRKTRILSLTAAVAANLIAVAVLFIVWLWWGGYV
jgi:nitrate/nitrite-specific signal transduction histidine kinase